jgi:putative transcriptional regulator
MTRHSILREDDRERAALHALGALDKDAAILFDAHLEICEACRAEVESHREAVAALGCSLDPVAPPDSLKTRLAEAVQAEREAAAIQTWKRWTPSAHGEAMTIVRGEDTWESTGVEGVEVRRLFVDVPNDRLTMLVRMAAGIEYPAHRHGGVEECYVLAGDLYGPGWEMRAGDYQRLEGGSVHGVQGTREGCVLFIASSMNDELLLSRP